MGFLALYHLYPHAHRTFLFLCDVDVRMLRENILFRVIFNGFFVILEINYED